MPVLLFAVFIDLVGFGLIVPILPFLMMEYGGTTLMGTGLISIYSLMAFASGPIWGRISDRFGRKPALALTFFGAVLSYIILSVSDTIIMLFIARAMAGTMAGNIGIAMATLSDISEPHNRGRVMGLLGAAFGLGFAIGPGIGGVLGAIGDKPNIFLPSLVAAFLSLIAMLCVLKFMPETNQNRRSTNSANTSKSDIAPESEKLPELSSIFKVPGIVPLFIMFIVVAVGQSVSFSIVPFWAGAALGWSEKEVGFLMMAIGLVVASIQIFAIGPLFKRLGETKSISLGSIIVLIGCGLLFGFEPSALVAFTSFPLIMSGLTLAFPGLNSIVSQRSDHRLQGSALGFSNGLSSLGRVVGPISSGIMFTAYNPSRPFLVLIAAATIVLIWGITESFLAKRRALPGAEPLETAP